MAEVHYEPIIEEKKYKTISEDDIEAIIEKLFDASSDVRLLGCVPSYLTEPIATKIHDAIDLLETATKTAEEDMQSED